MAGVYTDEEEKRIEEISQKRMWLIGMMEKDADLATTPRLIEVFSTLLKQEEEKVNSAAKLRIQKKESDNSAQIKLMVTDLLQSINTKSEAISQDVVKTNREIKTLEAKLVKGELEQGVQQFDMDKIEAELEAEGKGLSSGPEVKD